MSSKAFEPTPSHGDSFPRHSFRPGDVTLSELPAGAEGTLSSDRLCPEDRTLLNAIGLTEQSSVRVCRQGEPCIVEVHTTRVGLAKEIARQLWVSPSDSQATSQ